MSYRARARPLPLELHCQGIPRYMLRITTVRIHKRIYILDDSVDPAGWLAEEPVGCSLFGLIEKPRQDKKKNWSRYSTSVAARVCCTVAQRKRSANVY